MYIACWLPRATNTHSEPVITIAFPLQQWMDKRASILSYKYLDCLVYLLLYTRRLNVENYKFSRCIWLSYPTFLSFWKTEMECGYYVKPLPFSHFTNLCTVHLNELTASRRGQLKCDGTRAETSLSAKRTSPFKSAGGVSLVDYWQPRCAHQR